MYGSGSFYHQAKKVRKTLIPTVLWLLLDFLSLKNDVNVPSKSNKQKNCLKMLLLESRRSMMKIAGSASGSGSIIQRHGSADKDPDPHQNVMDPEYCWKDLHTCRQIKNKKVTWYIWEVVEQRTQIDPIASFLQYLKTCTVKWIYTASSENTFKIYHFVKGQNQDGFKSKIQCFWFPCKDCQKVTVESDSATIK